MHMLIRLRKLWKLQYYIYIYSELRAEQVWKYQSVIVPQLEIQVYKMSPVNFFSFNNQSLLLLDELNFCFKPKPKMFKVMSNM